MPSLLVQYHFMDPDNVVSARHFSDLCRGLRERGWEVEAAPCNRAYDGRPGGFPLRETRAGVRFQRVWRPPFKQSSSAGRIANALWMAAAWTRRAMSRRPPPDAVLTGTDPILGFASALAWKKFHPGVRLAHWCFDLFPAAAVADGRLRPESLPARQLDRLAARALRAHDLVADLGPDMRRRLPARGGGRVATIIPWALAEPPTPLPPEAAERRALFGAARIGLLYGGNFGRAHDCILTLELARRCRPWSIRFVFGVRGARLPELRAALRSDDHNVAIVPFADETRLAARLGAADIHLVSLRPEWAGLVAPSKFVGALAAGRPVIYEGPAASDIGRLVGQYRVGWTLTPQALPAIASQLGQFCVCRKELDELNRHCHAVYQRHFSMSRMVSAWDAELRRLLGADNAGRGGVHAV